MLQEMTTKVHSCCVLFRHYGELGWEEAGGGGQQKTRRGREEESQNTNCMYILMMNTEMSIW